MKFTFWNMRGFGKPARRQHRELIKEEGLDGVGIQETIKESFTQAALTELAGGSQFTWVWKSAKGHSGES
jgi:exonuclease III